MIQKLIKYLTKIFNLAKKKNMKTYLLAAIAALSLTISSCTKEGAVGPPGANGKNGVASINTVTIGTIPWIYDSNLQYYKASYTVPALTQAIADRGLVLAYLSQNGSYTPMPVSAFGLSFTYSFNPGNVIFEFSDDAGLINPNLLNYGAKIVLVPNGLKIPNNLNLKDYNAVIRFLEKQ